MFQLSVRYNYNKTAVCNSLYYGQIEKISCAQTNIISSLTVLINCKRKTGRLKFCPERIVNVGKNIVFYLPTDAQ